MNRNTELHFKNLPSVDVKRSMFDLSSGHKTTFNEGELVPIYVQEVLPGDTFKLTTNHVIRMTTPIKPTMDNAFLDFFYFFVPNRLVWDHWAEFMGENKTGAWDEQMPDYSIPTVTTTESKQFFENSVADHMGLPISIPGLPINALPFRDYVLIYNEWFRDQNLIAPLDAEIDTDSNTDLTASNYTSAVFGGNLLKVAKMHDYFTSALPAPQKGDAVVLPVGDTAPVIGNGKSTGFMINGNDVAGNHFTLVNGVDADSSHNWLWASSYPSIYNQDLPVHVTAGSKINVPSVTYAIGLDSDPAKSNVIADLSQAVGVSVNQFRQAVQVQRLLELDARGGTRYIESIKSHFGVTSPDARQQRPEYLGGKRVPINMAQVLQNSQSTEDSPLGNTAAYSLTGGRNDSFTKSFTEHGFIIGLACVRVEHSYQQGIDKMWSRQKRFDYYFPALANIGEQPILNKEIYAQGTSVDNEVFGYQEPWAEYRYKPNTISGEMRSVHSETQDVWHYADHYNSLPVLSQGWIEEGVANIDRTLAVTSDTAAQFLADFYFDVTATRPMPLYGIPGLVDHI